MTLLLISIAIVTILFCWGVYHSISQLQTFERVKLKESKLSELYSSQLAESMEAMKTAEERDYHKEEYLVTIMNLEQKIFDLQHLQQESEMQKIKLTEYMSVLNHEFRRPIVAIQGLINLRIEEAIDEKEFLRIIGEVTNEMDIMVKREFQASSYRQSMQ